MVLDGVGVVVVVEEAVEVVLAGVVGGGRVTGRAAGAAGAAALVGRADEGELQGLGRGDVFSVPLWGLLSAWFACVPVDPMN